MADLRQGRIVWVELPDPQGRNPKVRPAVVVTPTGQIQPGGEVQLVAVTGQTAGAPPEDQVPLPWLRTGHPTTGLSKPSVAVVTWQARVPESAIRSIRGTVPAVQLLAILSRIGMLPIPSPPPPEPPAASPPPPDGS